MIPRTAHPPGGGARAKHSQVTLGLSRCTYPPPDPDGKSGAKAAAGAYGAGPGGEQLSSRAAMEQRGLARLRLPGLLALLAALAARTPRVSASGDLNLWPLPVSLKTTPRLFYLSPGNFFFGHSPTSKAGPSCAVLQEAFRR